MMLMQLRYGLLHTWLLGQWAVYSNLPKNHNRYFKLDIFPTPWSLRSPTDSDADIPREIFEKYLECLCKLISNRNFSKLNFGSQSSFHSTVLWICSLTIYQAPTSRCQALHVQLFVSAHLQSSDRLEKKDTCCYK